MGLLVGEIVGDLSPNSFPHGKGNRFLVPSPCPRRGLGRGAVVGEGTTFRLSESSMDLMRWQALYLSRRHRYAAFADLSSDKERLGYGHDDSTMKVAR